MARRLGRHSGRSPLPALGSSAAVLTRPTPRLTDDGKIATVVRETGNLFATAFGPTRVVDETCVNDKINTPRPTSRGRSGLMAVADAAGSGRPEAVVAWSPGCVRVCG
jgi:hypothetical protein